MRIRGVDLQLRSHQTHPSSTYPHSLDRRILEGDQFREAKGRLESTIQSIERYYASPQSGSHGGPPNCDRCQKKIHDIGRAYYEYYLSNDPRCWYADSPQYKQAMQRVFDNPNGYSLDDAHFLSQSALRNHLKQDLCTAQPSDTSEINSLKYMISDVFNEGHSSTGDIINRYLHSIHHASRENPDAGSFVEALQPTTTPEERAQIYIKYYCSPSYNDTPPVKAFKSKYARIFESLAPHDEVLSAMRKEASDAQTSKVSKLRETLGELKMAQSAHLKGKKKKEEKNQRMMEREPSPRMVRCALDVCVNEVDIVGGGVVECAVCEWLEKKGGGRTVYCSVEHAEADFVSFCYACCHKRELI